MLSLGQPHHILWTNNFQQSVFRHSALGSYAVIWFCGYAVLPPVSQSLSPLVSQSLLRRYNPTVAKGLPV